jgi:hypothetical protein
LSWAALFICLCRYFPENDMMGKNQINKQMAVFAMFVTFLGSITLPHRFDSGKRETPQGGSRPAPRKASDCIGNQWSSFIA